MSVVLGDGVRKGRSPFGRKVPVSPSSDLVSPLPPVDVRADPETSVT